MPSSSSLKKVIKVGSNSIIIRVTPEFELELLNITLYEPSSSSSHVILVSFDEAYLIFERNVIENINEEDMSKLVSEFHDRFVRLLERDEIKVSEIEQIDKFPPLPDETSISLKIKGNNEYQNANYTEAEKCYSEAVIENPANPLLLLNISAVFMKTERFEEAVKNCKRSISLIRKEQAAYKHSGSFSSRRLLSSSNLYENQDEFKFYSTESDYFEVILSKAYYRMGTAYEKLSKDTRAMTSYILSTKMTKNPSLLKPAQDAITRILGNTKISHHNMRSVVPDIEELQASHQVYSAEDSFGFSCTMCGECCRSADYILLTPYDIFSLTRSPALSKLGLRTTVQLLIHNRFKKAFHFVLHRGLPMNHLRPALATALGHCHFAYPLYTQLVSTPASHHSSDDDENSREEERGERSGSNVSLDDAYSPRRRVSLGDSSWDDDESRPSVRASEGKEGSVVEEGEREWMEPPEYEEKSGHELDDDGDSSVAESKFPEEDLHSRLSDVNAEKRQKLLNEDAKHELNLEEIASVRSEEPPNYSNDSTPLFTPPDKDQRIIHDLSFFDYELAEVAESEHKRTRKKPQKQRELMSFEDIEDYGLTAESYVKTTGLDPSEYNITTAEEEAKSTSTKSAKLKISSVRNSDKISPHWTELEDEGNGDDTPEFSNSSDEDDVDDEENIPQGVYNSFGKQALGCMLGEAHMPALCKSYPVAPELSQVDFWHVRSKFWEMKRPSVTQMPPKPPVAAHYSQDTEYEQSIYAHENGKVIQGRGYQDWKEEERYVVLKTDACEGWLEGKHQLRTPIEGGKYVENPTMAPADRSVNIRDFLSHDSASIEIDDISSHSEVVHNLDGYMRKHLHQTVSEDREEEFYWFISFIDEVSSSIDLNHVRSHTIRSKFVNLTAKIWYNFDALNCSRTRPIKSYGRLKREIQSLTWILIKETKKFLLKHGLYGDVNQSEGEAKSELSDEFDVLVERLCI